MTDPSPVYRGKPGSKIHALSDRAGLPLAVAVSAANTHDSRALKPLVMAIPAVRGGASQPSCTPTKPTTSPTSGAGSATAASRSASPAKASNPRTSSANTAG
jgi:hypothetical protein